MLSAPYSVEGLLQPDQLSAYGELYGAPVLQRMVEYRRETRRLNAGTLVGMEALDVAGPAKGVGRTDAPENAAAGSLDEEIQTPLHFHERFIDPNYTSSEWELRARALALYKIQQKRTEATETEVSAAKVAGTT